MHDSGYKTDYIIHYISGSLFLSKNETYELAIKSEDI